ncbi:MAG: hypothetical protein P4L82_16750 [Ancalomicrobiaceae bacterium]|nr:hypothetical protein [Ancalomicrobiaceae bacterium]
MNAIMQAEPVQVVGAPKSDPAALLNAIIAGMLIGASICGLIVIGTVWLR